jgi:formylglycine-generating enzyme
MPRIEDSGASSSGSSSGVDAGGCTPGVSQCSGASAMQTCNASGQWGAPWSCATGTCDGGACTGSTTTGASCQTSGPGLTNCGASSESCCTSLPVTGGTYYRTYDEPIDFDPDGGPTLAADGGPTGFADPAMVGGFRMDKYLVTVGRFRQFVSAWNGGAGYTPPAGSGKHTHLNGGNGLNATGGGYEPGWVTTDDVNIAPTNTNLACSAPYATWTTAAGTSEMLPINCVNWYEAYAFCIWDGGFLPSEAEWEYAAAGGSQQREYPWGSPDPGTSNQYAIYDCEYPNGSGSCTDVASVAPVGTATLGAGLWGQLDLAGEVFEWNLDWYNTYVDPCIDCVNTTAASSRVLRGGYFFDRYASLLLPPNRSTDAPANRGYDYGFRCSRIP